MKYTKDYFLLFITLIGLSSCFVSSNEDTCTTSGLHRKDFQTSIQGKKTDLYVLTNADGLEACITNYGARVVSLMVPDKNGKKEDVVLGFDNIQTYIEKGGSFGATIGRYIGRIANGRFTLDSLSYQLPQNSGSHCIHGGTPNFGAKVWDVIAKTDSSLTLFHRSPDGENGFPGNLDVTLTYTLNYQNALDIQIQAETDKATVLNIANHSFFNLSGDANKKVEDQLLTIHANHFTPYDSTKCVDGRLLNVEGTPFDFRSAHTIGKYIEENDEQLKLMGGYDHSFLLTKQKDDVTPEAILHDPASGRTMEVYTTEPAIHVYTANNLTENEIGKNNIRYKKRSAICLETMHLQDSPNQKHFPSTILRPGETFKSHTSFKFLF